MCSSPSSSIPLAARICSVSDATTICFTIVRTVVVLLVSIRSSTPYQLNNTIVRPEVVRGTYAAVLLSPSSGVLFYCRLLLLPLPLPLAVVVLLFRSTTILRHGFVHCSASSSVTASKYATSVELVAF